LLGDLGSFNAVLGRSDAAITAAELALRLDPRNPTNHWWRFALARAHFAAGNYELAREWARKVPLALKDSSEVQFFGLLLPLPWTILRTREKR
jgi:tetratricopeptide (TPR) repeat protein